MAGLNYGNKFSLKKAHADDPGIGVSYASKIKKWIVRIRKPSGTITTMKAFNTQQEAEDYYKELTNTALI